MIAKYRKAVAGLVMAFVSAALTAYLPDHVVTSNEWLASVAFALGTLGVVAVVPNAGQVYPPDTMRIP